ncbi:MAG TPA: hypothetical protein VGQ36_06090 [Thermoanaerobaculia bacterium]|jgi:hypothetical protein|nr:hypothetical protein [Thermoanaerobaculia bacterium]
MREKARSILLALVVWCCVTATSADACTCSGPANAAEGLEQSSTVFRGKVIGIRQPFLDRIGLTRTGHHRVEFAVSRQWKGRRSTRIVVRTRMTGEACGFPFRVNEEYLVYVMPGRTPETGICTGTKRIADAAADMAQLEAIHPNIPGHCLH